MARSSLYRVGLESSLNDVTRPRNKINRYQYEQRFTLASWGALLIVIVVLSAWAHHHSSARRSDSADSAAMPSSSGAASSRPLSLPTWLNKSASSINELVAARNNIATAAARHDIAMTGAACRSASSAVAEVRQELPSPEPVLNSTLHDAVDSYEIGLPYCVRATQTQDAEEMRRAASYISNGDAAMRAALDFFDRSSGAGTPGVAVMIV